MEIDVQVSFFYFYKDGFKGKGQNKQIMDILKLINYEPNSRHWLEFFIFSFNMTKSAT